MGNNPEANSNIYESDYKSYKDWPNELNHTAIAQYFSRSHETREEMTRALLDECMSGSLECTCEVRNPDAGVGEGGFSDVPKSKWHHIRDGYLDHSYVLFYVSREQFREWWEKQDQLDDFENKELRTLMKWILDDAALDTLAREQRKFNTPTPIPTEIDKQFLADLFEPRPLPGVASAFDLFGGREKPLKQRTEFANLKQWTEFANRAKRNGLKAARIDEGRGRRKSTYNLYLVGEWLIKEGKADQARINRILKNNLPFESKGEAHRFD